MSGADELDAARGGEARTRRVLVLTLVMMVAEVGAGWHFGSMALLADGWHMLTHAAAMGISVFAYGYARRHANNPAFVFGTGKVSALGGFSSAIVLGVVAIWVALTSAERLWEPVAIHYNEALIVTGIGLLVNLVSALMLSGGSDHHHDHEHDHGHDHHHHDDHNLRAAYMHVLADALTSVMALVALLTAKYFSVVWVDPAMGIVAALVISKWSIGLIADTSRVLLDANPSDRAEKAIREAIEASGEHQVVNLKLWNVGAGRLAGMLWVSSKAHHHAAYFRALIPPELLLVHLAVEVVDPA